MPQSPEPSAELPQYLVDAVERQSPERLESVATWARELAEYKRTQRARAAQEQREADEIDEEEKAELEEQGIDVNPDAADVPGNAYITIKETKPGYRYYYWQWREDSDTWKNEYIAPVNPKQ